MNLIGPFGFAMNLLVYLMTGSKYAANMIGPISGGGCYATLIKWLDVHGSQAIKCNFQDDVITFFDNAQGYWGKNWHVHLNCKVLLSCITTIIHISSSVYFNI